MVHVVIGSAINLGGSLLGFSEASHASLPVTSESGSLVLFGMGLFVVAVLARRARGFRADRAR
jgi:hypothetical protein